MNQATHDPDTKLSVQITGLTSKFGDSSVTLGEILDVLKGRTYLFFLILLCIPFCTPVPAFGLSTPSGIIVLLIGIRLSLGQKPWLPSSLLSKKVPNRFFPSFLKVAGKLIRFLEYISRPRLLMISENKFASPLCGLLISLSGFLLLLPLPIPLSNMLPAFTVILLSMAMIENDGLMIIAGVAMFIITVLFFVLIGVGGVAVFDWVKDLLGFTS